MPRDRRILDAAAVAFHEKGFHGVGMDELGRRAGLSGPSLYRYFAGKDEILARLLDEAMDELLGATTPVDPDPRTDLERALRHHIEFALANRHLVTLYQREVRSLVEPWADAFTRRRRQYVRAWETLLARAFPTLEPGAVAAAAQGCLGLVFSVATWPDRALAAPGVTDLIMGLVLHGVAGVDLPA
ncbi:TetR/AcrR family transcriptional regulator [Nocardioides humi]|uniref:TetR/AcrR family transcriptional regulator n=1 Tax=Nocardioides humi TaxID=449461 RepID=A0ABN2AYN0_9ACTN|nr:TetR/AcrR family transcriptional regulator [Nocardioides humi]